MKYDRLASGLFLGVILLASPVFAQSNVPRLNTDGIVKAFGMQGELAGEMYWAYGDAVSLAKGLKAALDRVAS